MGALRSVAWMLFDREPSGAAQIVRTSAAGAVAGAVLLHLAMTGPWVADAGRAVRVQTVVSAPPTAAPGVVR